MKFIVLGDLIFDRFIYGDINRISPEAPVPILDVNNIINSCGGAYNVYAHIQNLGFNSKIISIIGYNFLSLKEAFFPNGVTNNEIFIFEEFKKSPIKTRLIANYNHNHQIRFDDEDINEITIESQKKILNILNIELDENTFLIINDYKKGVITKELLFEITKLSKIKNSKVFVDSKRDVVDIFKNTFLLKPNLHEFNQIKLRYNLSDSFEDACKELIKMLNLTYLVVTKGDNGIFCCDSAMNTFTINSKPVKVKELSGAGDSVLASLCVALSEGYQINEAVIISNNIAAKFIQEGPLYRASINDFKL